MNLINVRKTLPAPTRSDAIHHPRRHVQSLIVRSVQETYPSETKINKRQTTYSLAELTVILETRRLARKPQSLRHARSQVILMKLRKARRPITITSSEQLVRVPAREGECQGFGDGDIGIHGLQDLEDLGLDLGVGEGFDSF